MEKSIEFVDIVGCVASLRKQGVDDKTTWSTLHDHFLLGLNRCRVIRAKCYVEVENGALVFMAEK